MATLTYRDAVGRALQDSLREDPRLILIGQNIAGYTLKQMAEEFGESRIRDTSISESAMVGMAVGAAMKGWKAVVMIAYADISSVCHKAIVQSAAKMHYLTCGRLRCPVVIRLPIARFRGHGPMGNEVAVSWFYNVPDLNIAMPASADEAYWCFRDALQRPTPTLFFEDRSIHNRSGEITAAHPDARARVTRAGDRLTIIAAGRTAALAEDAADQLAKEGNRGAVEVVSLGFIKPLDRETILQAASKTRRVLIVQDEPPCSGYAPYVRCLLDELPRGAPAVTPRIISGADEYLPYWDERPFLPSLEGLVAVAAEMLK
jgi:acetoin:2,6-dichlorophenolindophenol oxidoreductase subunit beta